MKVIMKSFLCLCTLTTLSGCISVNYYPYPSPNGTSNISSQDCVSATRQVRNFKVLSDREIIVYYSDSHRYRVVLNHACPKLREVPQIGFASGPDRYIGYNSSNRSPIYANPIEGSARICGRGGDRVVLREQFSDFTRPSEGCQIQSIERMP